MYHKSTRCISILFYTNKHDKTENNCVILEILVILSLLYNAQESLDTTRPLDTGRKLDVHKTFRRRPGRLLNVLWTFSLRPVSRGSELKFKNT